MSGYEWLVALIVKVLAKLAATGVLG